MRLIDFVPIVLAIVCYALAGLFSASPSVSTALIGLAGVMAGLALPQLSVLLGRPTPATTPPAADRPPRGPGLPGLIVVLSALSSAGVAPPARADDVVAETVTWRHGPSVAVAVVTINVKTGAVVGGPAALPLGACYGLTYAPAAVGLDLCANVQLSTQGPNRYFPSLVLHARDYVTVGAGVLGTQGAAADGGLLWQWLLLVGGRYGLLGG